jgi:uncharacterized protein YciI
MPYIIENIDRLGTVDLRRSVRAEYPSYLEEHRAKLLVCGAKLKDDRSDASGGIYFLDVEDRAVAEESIDARPFAKTGLFERITITRWCKASLDWVNHFVPVADLGHGKRGVA